MCFNGDLEMSAFRNDHYFLIIVFQVTEWLNRKAIDGRAVIAVSAHKTSTQQVASFALTQEEEAVRS